jgi:hypothetical protein
MALSGPTPPSNSWPTNTWPRGPMAAGSKFNDAVNGLEANLSRDPNAQGESRSGPFRVVYDLPATLLYRVDEAGKKVVILAVRYLP